MYEVQRKRRQENLPHFNSVHYKFHTASHDEGTGLIDVTGKYLLVNDSKPL
jgi:hypothetical protein